MIEKDKKAAICVTGWYFDPEFYKTVVEIPQTDVYVISHKKRSQVPKQIFEIINPKQLFFEPNIGYDWGCYQQFYQKNIWLKYPYTVFMHDDIIIKNHDFLEPCIALLEKHSVIGNGRVAGERFDCPDYVPESYAHSSWKPPSRQFRHTAVRGSFFMTSRDSLKRIRKFEVSWDLFRLTSGLGNWSTRATCAKWQYLYGEKCFGFLSENYCESDYILELVRGGKNKTNNSPIKQKCFNLLRAICRIYMSIYWRRQRIYESV